MGNLYIPQKPTPVIGRRFPMVRNHRRRILAQYDFDSTASIVNGYGGGTAGLALDTTNFRIGSAGVIMPIPAGQTQYRYNNPAQWSAFDISGGFELEVSWYAPSAVTGGLRIGLISNGTINQYSVENVMVTSVEKAAGWHRVRFKAWGAGSSFDAANVTGWEARMLAGVAGDTIVLDQIKVMSPASMPPTVIWRNDDANVDVVAMAAYLEKYGYYILSGVVGSFVGTGTYATVAQLRDLADRGHLIVSHTWSHKNWTTLTVQQCVDEVRRNYDWLVNNHLGRGASILISPYHWQAPAGFVAEVMGRTQGMVDLILSTRHKSVGYPISGEQTDYKVADTNDSRLIGIMASDATASATYINDTLTSRPGPCVLLYHHLDRGGITTTNFRLAVDKAAELDAAGTIDVLTLDEYLLRAAMEDY